MKELDIGFYNHPELYVPKNELDELAIKYGTDKTAYYIHDYTTIYHSLYKNRREDVKKVLEIGIGIKEVMWYIPNYKIGASLYMWRDYFPNAEIYGIDIEPKVIFQDERIHTIQGNQGLSGHLFNAIETFGKEYDLIIDDGSHNINDQLISAIVLMYYLKSNGYYIIEDVKDPEPIIQQLQHFGYKLEFKKLPSVISEDEGLLVITK